MFLNKNIYYFLTFIVQVISMSQVSKIQNSLMTTKDPVVRERLLMVQTAYKEPLRTAAKKFGCVHTKVNFWKKRYEQQGVKGLRTKAKIGRPSKISEEQTIRLRRIVRKHNMKHGWRTQNVRELIAKEADVNYSFRHTIRIIQSWGMSKIQPRPRYAFSKQEDRQAFLKKPRRTWHANQRIGQ